MAEKSPETEKKKVRLVKNPETFRERAVKAAESGDRPSKRSRLSGLGGKLVKPLRPIGRLFKALLRVQPFKFIAFIFKLIGKILVPPYFRRSWGELRLVTWPNKRQSRDLTFAVLMFAIVFGGVIAIVDFGLDKVFKALLLK